VARGWESKAVEDQIASAAERDRRPAAPDPGPEERARAARRATLQLARASALQDIQRACNPRHRALIEAAVADLDEQIKTLG
jgi:hypothetical protein